MFKSKTLLFIVIFPLVYCQRPASIFKITKVHCESFNKSLAVINSCRLKPVKRNISKFSANLTLLEKFYDIKVNGDWRKKSSGYKPFLYNVTVDICSFMRKRNNPLFNLVYNLFKDFSNINHTCPYYGDQILDGFYPKVDNLVNNLPVPDGEYALFLTWIFNNKNLVATNAYFEFYKN